MEKETEIIKGKLVNTILQYAIENQMSLENIYECLDIIAEQYYTDGVIIRRD